MRRAVTYDGAAAAAAAACAGIYQQLRRARLISTRFQLTGWLVGVEFNAPLDTI